MRELPDELIREVLARVPLEFLLEARRCSHTICALACEDVRWLPIVAPPSLQHERSLSIVAHSKVLIRLFAQYIAWRDNWLELYEAEDVELQRAQTKALDGFFALAPWTRLAVDGEIVDGDGLWAPLGWLQTMAHARDEPPRSAMAFLGGAHRSSSRLRPLSVDQKLSRFYQQRERDDDDHDETFFSIPVGVSEAYEYREPLHRRYVVQPLDVVDVYDRTEFELPHLSGSALHAAAETAKALLCCYLPVESVVVPHWFEVWPLDTHDEAVVRRELFFLANGVPVHQVQMNAFIGAEEFVECNSSSGVELIKEGSFTALLTAVHLRPSAQDGAPKKGVEWVSSAPVEEITIDGHHAWCVSSCQLEAHLEHSEPLRRRVLVGMLLRCVLVNGVGLDDNCENEPCALNHCGSVGESVCTSLLLCPCCLRKLQFLGHLPGTADGAHNGVAVCLGKLHSLLNAPELRAVSQTDLRVLHEWGHGQGSEVPGSSSDAPVWVV